MSRLPFRIAAISACLAALLPAAAPAANNAAAYHLTKSGHAGSPEQWDYLVFDPATHDVYVSHGDRVSVVVTAATAISLER